MNKNSEGFFLNCKSSVFFLSAQIFFIEVLAAQCDKGCRKGNIEYRYINISFKILCRRRLFLPILFAQYRVQRGILSTTAIGHYLPSDHSTKNM